MTLTRPFRNFALAMALAALLAPPPALAGTMPRLEADSLGGTHVVLPGDAAGKPLVILLAFTKESQDDLKEWSRKLLEDHVAGSASVYVVVVADRMAFFERRHVRKIVEGASVGSEAQRNSNVLITFDGTGWRELVPPGDKRTAGIVVCDADGLIVYAKRERFNEDNLADVEKAAK
jgi:hypothetical protein